MPTFGGPFGGVLSPTIGSGEFRMSHWLGWEGSTMATTAARIYYVRYYVDKPTTFAGAKFRNGGAGDNGEKFKVALYAETSATNGLPGSLVKDFGEATLTGAAAIRTLASSVSVAAGWYWLAIVGDSASTMSTVTFAYNASDAGEMVANPLAGLLGDLTLTMPGTAGDIFMSYPVGYYVDGTYATFPLATATAPTTGIYGRSAFPGVGLYA